MLKVNIIFILCTLLCPLELPCESPWETSVLHHIHPLMHCCWSLLQRNHSSTDANLVSVASRRALEYGCVWIMNTRTSRGRYPLLSKFAQDLPSGIHICSKPDMYSHAYTENCFIKVWQQNMPNSCKFPHSESDKILQDPMCKFHPYHCLLWDWTRSPRVPLVSFHHHSQTLQPLSDSLKISDCRRLDWSSWRWSRSCVNSDAWILLAAVSDMDWHGLFVSCLCSL